jgi:membrane-associated phospholipid phosphatase
MILVAVLGGLFAHETEADGFDRALDAPVITWFAHRPELAFRLSTPGSALPAVGLSAVLVAACLLTGRLNAAVLAGLAVPVAVGLVEVVLKPLVHRTYRGILAYPSGHTTAMFALASTITILLLTPAPSRRAWRARALVSFAACLFGSIVAMAVIGLRWHYATDTIAGAALGIATVCGLALALDRFPATCATLLPPHASAIRPRPGVDSRTGPLDHGPTND